MSERTRNLPRRSCLSIPGSSEKMLGKGPNIPADMIFLDLEDSVSPLEKEASRAKVVEAIKTQDWGEKVLCVRVNAWDTEWTAYDIIEVVGNAGERLEEIMPVSYTHLDVYKRQDEGIEPRRVVGDRAGAEAEADADLHGP